jgi:hypothetical protein
VCKKKNILGRFLLTTYLLVAFNCSFSHDHLALFDESCEVSHCHEVSEKVFLAQDFHIGIFHYLGHLFEELRHIDNDDFGNDHLVISSDFQSKNNLDLNRTIDFHFGSNNIIVTRVDSESLSSSPNAPSPTQRLLRSAIPSRAPPALV